MMPQKNCDAFIIDFLHELEEYASTQKKLIAVLSESPTDDQAVGELHRITHIIRGDAALLGIESLAAIAKLMEDMLDDVMAGHFSVGPQIIGVMNQSVDCFAVYSRHYADGGLDEAGIVKKAHDRYRDISQATGSAPGSENEAAAGPGAGGTDLDKELLEDFHEEAEDHLEQISTALQTLSDGTKGADPILSEHRKIIKQLRRSVHTLKGAAAICGLSVIADWAHGIEDALDWLFEEAVEFGNQTVDDLIGAIDLLEGLIFRPTEVSREKLAKTAQRLKAVIPGDGHVHQDGQAHTQAPVTAEAAEPGDGSPGRAHHVDAQAHRAAPVDSTSRNRDRIVKDQVAQKTAPDQPSVPPQPGNTLRIGMARIDNLVNLAGEITIATSGFDQKITNFDVFVTELRQVHGRLKEIARKLESGYEVRALENVSSAVAWKTDHPGHTGDETFEEFDNLELDRYSELSLIIRSLNEATIDIGTIQNQFKNLSGDFAGNITRQQVLLSEMQNKMMQVRLTAFGVLSNRLRRTVRDVAAKLNKKVDCIIEGEQIELDRAVWDKLMDPLMHLLRNAVDHTIEPPAIRKQLGKSPSGTIKITASREGNQVVLRVCDDGAGLNYAAIHQKALAQGLLSDNHQATDDELADLILRQGFSTQDNINQFSGRGVGLDVVKSNVAALQGVLRVFSKRGQGTGFVIYIPVSLAVVRAILFSVGDQQFALHLSDIKEIFRVNADQVINEPKPAIQVENKIIPLFPIKEVLPLASSTLSESKQTSQLLMMIVETNSGTVGFEIDRLNSQREIVIKNLGSHLRNVPGVSGATIMGDGSVVPIIELEGLLHKPSEVNTTTTASSSNRYFGEKPLDVLLVDDSVMVRKVVARLMESQGWKAHTARDGREALDRLSELTPDVIILDIEMPHMNGFELLKAIKAQESYQQIPVIMLTSRATAKHRQKALALGADHYAIKPYRDKDFLAVIRQVLASRQTGTKDDGFDARLNASKVS
jgi:chemosensory pili system protein ChpA (sensor histidine kinase/response regulator)